MEAKGHMPNFGAEFRPLRLDSQFASSSAGHSILSMSACLKSWNDLLSNTVKDDLKKETNLVLLGRNRLLVDYWIGNSKENCLNVADRICGSTHHGESKRRDTDVIHYSYTKASHSSRKNTKDGRKLSFFLMDIDYYGVFNVYILTDDSFVDVLELLIGCDGFKNVSILYDGVRCRRSFL